ncbi:hypothetical protein [Sharpea azabuensis]|uniref:hypothetical protein n=1 Tax=Sharpea azabuensis TaxID=322505 RepID=UPI001568059D|nr:hypothetical protein [Sharpea azabuensis]
MITYVNTVLVSNADSLAVVSAAPETDGSDAGKLVILNCDDATQTYISTAAQAAAAKSIKVGLVTDKTSTAYGKDGVAHVEPVIKWSNIIKADDVKGIATQAYTADVPESTAVDFTGIDNTVLEQLALGGKRIIVRLTFKDLPTRYRNWTESYEYVTQHMDVSDATAKTAAVTKIASDIATLINKQWKRARVNATALAGVLTLTALPYDDDNSVDSINWANTVRFNTNIYYTDPAAEGWESTNKLFPQGVTITKTPGTVYTASAKLVRDRESQAMGYLGILNRGEGTWPIIKPEMTTDLNAHYNALTLEFENMYRAADDIFRKTKQTLEIYSVGANTSVKALFDAFITRSAS